MVATTVPVLVLVGTTYPVYIQLYSPVPALSYRQIYQYQYGCIRIHVQLYANTTGSSASTGVGAGTRSSTLELVLDLVSVVFQGWYY